jgi:peroxiredoxin
VPDFELLDITGTLHTLADYRGKILVINFWAMWCAPCLQEMPSLQRAWSQLQHDNIQILSINIGDGEAELSAFVKVFQVDFPVLMDKALGLTQTWSVTALPTTFVLDARGYVVYTVLGERPWDNPTILEQIRHVQGAAEIKASATRPEAQRP